MENACLKETAFEGTYCFLVFLGVWYWPHVNMAVYWLSESKAGCCSCFLLHQTSML